MVDGVISGVVYVVQLEGHDLVKIGSSNNPARRLSQISTQSGLRIKRSYISEVHNNYKWNERRLHKRYKHRRRHGEYFALDFEEVVEKIKSLRV